MHMVGVMKRLCCSSEMPNLGCIWVFLEHHDMISMLATLMPVLLL